MVRNWQIREPLACCDAFWNMHGTNKHVVMCSKWWGMRNNSNTYLKNISWCFTFGSGAGSAGARLPAKVKAATHKVRWFGDPIFSRFGHPCQPPKKNLWNLEMETLVTGTFVENIRYTTWKFWWSVLSKSLVLLRRFSFGSSYVAVPGDLGSVPSWVSASVVPDLSWFAKYQVFADVVWVFSRYETNLGNHSKI